MSFAEALEVTVNRAAALAEVKRHNLPVEDFLAECGDKVEYSAEIVLHWLGY